MKTYTLIFISAFLIQSCSSPQQKVEITDSITIADSTNKADSVIKEKINSPLMFKGLYTYGNEVRTFRDCSGNKTVYWVVDSSANLQTRYKKTNRFPAYPYESVYAEVKGYLTGKSNMGYASEYKNVLVVTDIIKVEPKNFRTACYNYEFIALGNEPFWSVDIIPDEKRIVFKNVGQEKAVEFIYKPASVSAGVYRYEATNPSNKKIVVVIRKEKCSDGMSDRQYNYSAQVIIDGTVFKGCAIKKGDNFPSEF